MLTFKKLNQPILILGCSLLLLGMDSKGPISAESRRPDPALLTLQRYLNIDCEVGEKKRALDELLFHKAYIPKFQSFLVKILKEGPDKKTREMVKEALAYEFDSRKNFLESGPDLGLSKRETKILKSVTKEEYIERGLQLFIRQYRERAALAIAAFKTPDGLRVLLEASQTSDTVLQRVIKHVIKKYHGEEGYQMLGGSVTNQ